MDRDEQTVEAIAQHLHGVRYRQEGRWADALAAQRRALALRPDLAEAHYEVGVLNLELQKHDDALAAFRSAIEHDPESAEAQYGLGCAYRHLSQYDRAIAACNEALRLRPAYVLAWEETGVTYGEQKEAPMAAARFISISGRNQLKGTVEDVQVEGLLAQVRLRVGDQTLTAVITRDAVQDLQLKRGDRATAVIKSTEVMIEK